ncbi:hypothetical protein HY625_02300 [Candidatus Uhrbacteria bacterium]|nr:hypothetical protein [Candidatus Uhrbacteria bacterium]
MRQNRSTLIVALAVVTTGVVLWFWGKSFSRTIADVRTIPESSPAFATAQEQIRESIGKITEQIQQMKKTTETTPQVLSPAVVANIQERLQSEGKTPRRAPEWTSFTSAEQGYTIAYPDDWNVDTAKTNSQSLFLRDTTGAFLWMTLPALGEAPTTGKKKNVRISGTTSAERMDSDGAVTVQFRRGEQHGLLRIEYPFARTADYAPVIERMITSFTFTLASP